MVVAIIRKEGLALLEHLELNTDASHSDNATACGYVREDGRIAYTDYYEAVLEARNTHQGYSLKLSKVILSLSSGTNLLIPNYFALGRYL